MSAEVQTILNVVLLLVVAFVGGTVGLRRFEAIDRSIADQRTELEGDIAGLRTELRSDIAELRSEIKADDAELRTQLVQLRSDVTYIALAVGARPAQGSGSVSKPAFVT